MRPPDYVFAAGLVWLIAYVSIGGVRDWTLGLLWQLELAVAGPLGLALRRPPAAAPQPDLVASLTVIGIYCAVSWLVASGRDCLPLADELLGPVAAGELVSSLGERDR